MPTPSQLAKEFFIGSENSMARRIISGLRSSKNTIRVYESGKKNSHLSPDEKKNKFKRLRECRKAINDLVGDDTDFLKDEIKAYQFVLDWRGLSHWEGGGIRLVRINAHFCNDNGKDEDAYIVGIGTTEVKALKDILCALMMDWNELTGTTFTELLKEGMQFRDEEEGEYEDLQTPEWEEFFDSFVDDNADVFQKRKHMLQKMIDDIGVEAAKEVISQLTPDEILQSYEFAS